MNISKFIKENNNPYIDNLDTQIERVEQLVENNTISPRLGKFVINYLIRRNVSNIVKHNLEDMLQIKYNDKLLLFNYNRKLTHYI